MPTLPNMSIITPTLGGDSGSWDDKINAGFGLVDAHDHTSGKGLRIKTAAMTIDADLTFGGFAATNLSKAAFSAVTALAAGTKTLFVSSADNELYWRSNAGTNVKLTSGTSLNTSLVGGIVGDYSTVGAALAYDDANKRYTFKTQTATWARLASGPVRIHEYNTTESVYVEFAVAAALAASYTVTWPAALPGTTAIVQISAAGLVSYSNALPQLSANLDVAGFRILHTDAKVSGPLDGGDNINLSAGSYSRTAGTPGGIVSTVTEAYFRILPVTWTQRLKGIYIFGVPGASAAGATLYKYDSTGGTYTRVAVVGGTGVGLATVSYASGAWSLVPTVPAVQPGYVYVISILTGGGGTCTLINYDLWVDTVA